MLITSFRQELTIVRRLLDLLEGYRWFLPTVVVLGLISAVFEGLSLSLFIPLLQTLGNSRSGAGAQGPLVEMLRESLSVVPPELGLVVIIGAIFTGILLKLITSTPTFDRGPPLLQAISSAFVPCPARSACCFRSMDR